MGTERRSRRYMNSPSILLGICPLRSSLIILYHKFQPLFNLFLYTCNFPKSNLPLCSYLPMLLHTPELFTNKRRKHFSSPSSKLSCHPATIHTLKTKRTNHIRPSLPRDMADMQRQTSTKRKRGTWSLLKEPFALVGKVIKDCFKSANSPLICDTENTTGN